MHKAPKSKSALAIALSKLAVFESSKLKLIKESNLKMQSLKNFIIQSKKGEYGKTNKVSNL